MGWVGLVNSELPFIRSYDLALEAQSTMQSNLPLDVGLLYECANPKCFYVGSLLTMHETNWKEYWDSTFEDLIPRPVCPSCQQPMMTWEEDVHQHEQTT